MSDLTSTVKPCTRREVSSRKRGWGLKLRKLLGQNKRTKGTDLVGVTKREESPPAEVIMGYIGFISFQTWGEKSRNLGNFYEQSSKENEVPWYIGFLGTIQDKGPKESSGTVGFISSPLELLILAKIHFALVRPSQSLLLKFGSERFLVIT